MNISNEVLISIIGAIAAIIGAVFSTISIILSNKNKKNINLLENSKNVKADIANKRYDAYNKIINYINSWYDVDNFYEHDYFKCQASEYLKMTVFKNRLTNTKKILDELNIVRSLSLEYFYLDAYTYVYLKALENYLGAVLNYAYLEEIKNFKLFSYVIYCDIWDYVLKLFKYVNKFIKQSDILKYTPSNKFKHKIVKKMYLNSNYYNIYFKFLLLNDFARAVKAKINPQLAITNNKIAKVEENIKTNSNKKAKKLLKKELKLLKKVRQILTRHPSKNFTNYKTTKALKMWQICSECKDAQCYLNCTKNGKT